MDVDDATPEEFIVAAVREVLRSLLMYRLPTDLSDEDATSLLQLFRSLITLLTTADPDTNFLCYQSMQTYPVKWDSAFESHQDCLSACLMINAADAFSPSKDAYKYRDDAISALAELPRFTEKANYLRYSNQDIDLTISDFDALDEPLFRTDYEWEVPATSDFPLTSTLKAKYWQFWDIFLSALASGDTSELDFWRYIAKIKDDIWYSGPHAIANEIEKIREELLEPPSEQFKDHIKTLQPRFSVIAPQADKLADLIEAALNEFQREVSNKIPDSIEPLTKLPPILRKIALQMAKGGGQGQIDAIADLVAAMSETITVLNSRLERANRLHPDDRSLDQSRLGRFFDSNGMSGWLLAGVTTFFSLVSGPAGDATAQQTIKLTVNQACITDLEAVEPPRPEAPVETEEPSDLPETKDI